MDDLKIEIASYVKQVTALSAEVERLREQQSTSLELFERAKCSWRQQALQHADRVLERSKSQEAVKLYFLAQEVEKYRQQAIVERARSIVASPPTFPFLQDFDVEDQHVSVVNRTGKPARLQDYTLSIRDEVFSFPVSVPLVLPNETVSVWFGSDRVNLGNNAERRSLHWSGMESKSVKAGDTAHLSKGEVVVSSVASNQSCSVDLVTSRKRKHSDSDFVSQSSPLPRLSSTERCYGALHLQRVELSGTQSCKVWLHNQSAEEAVVVGRNWKLLIFSANLPSPETVSLGTRIVVPANGTEKMVTTLKSNFGAEFIYAVYLVDDLGCAISCLDCVIAVGDSETRKQDESNPTSCSVQ